MSTLRTNAILDASGGTTATVNGYAPSLSNMAGRNRIINGDMRIDQRNAGASVTAPTGGYSVDRWATFLTNAAFSVQQVSTAPSGFNSSLLLTTTTAGTPASTDYRFLQQAIEGFNAADLGWGTANAQAVTLSFWVRSSLTGTFGGSLKNSAENRSYPFTFSIASANTFEYKTITIAGDTTGTWLATSAVGIRVCFDLGSGSNRKGTAGVWAGSNFDGASGSVNLVATSGATFYITGVQLEAGSIATPFERRLYGDELARCQRYFQAFNTDNGLSTALCNGLAETSSAVRGIAPLVIQMRSVPTVSVSNITHFRIYTTNAHVFTGGYIAGTSTKTMSVVGITGGAMTAGHAGQVLWENVAGHVHADSEL